jgi:thiol-disulfide isomerase/thioredoxin
MHHKRHHCHLAAPFATAMAVFATVGASFVFAADSSEAPTAVPTVSTTPTPTTVATESADAMLARYRALVAPVADMTRREDAEYIKQYLADLRAYEEKRSEIAWAFYQQFPEHPKTGALLSNRWQSMLRSAPGQVLQEAESVADRKPAVPARVDAMFVRVAMHLMGFAGPGSRAKGSELLDAFLKEYPKDARGPMMLDQVAQMTADPVKKQQIKDRLERDYPGSVPVRLAIGTARRQNAIGQPFELKFNDATTGKAIDVGSMKGKVVVIDFWATWCGPCVAAMPGLKALYARHYADGLEIVGVSLDAPESDGGLASLKEFVKNNDIPWPQYYQGAQWEGDFSMSWGINMVPTTFVISREGKVVSTEPGEGLEALVIEQLKLKS